MANEFESVRLIVGSRHRDFVFRFTNNFEMRASIFDESTHETIYKNVAEQTEKAIELFRIGAIQVDLKSNGKVIGVLMMEKDLPL